MSKRSTILTEKLFILDATTKQQTNHFRCCPSQMVVFGRCFYIVILVRHDVQIIWSMFANGEEAKNSRKKVEEANDDEREDNSARTPWPPPWSQLISTSAHISNGHIRTICKTAFCTIAIRASSRSVYVTDNKGTDKESQDKLVFLL